MAIRIVTLPLSIDKPPLTLNQNTHHMKRSRIVRQLREEVVTLLRIHKVPKPAEHVEVEFHYRPKTNRTRDTDNLAPTIKPLVDALTPGRPAEMRPGGKIIQPIAGYGLVPDDTPQYVARPEPTIHPPHPNASCWLRLTITYKEDQ